MANTNTAHENLLSSSAQNAIPWMIISKLLLFIIYFLISVITVRYLGTDQYGVFVICRSIADILILVCTLGMTAAYIRFIPELVVFKNVAGIKRLIRKAFLIQTIALGIAGIGLYLSHHLIERHFSIAFNGALLFTFILMVCELFKTNINSILTALYQTKRLALFSSLNGLIWLVGLVILLEKDRSVESVLSAQSFSYALIYFIAAIILAKYLFTLKWQSPDKAIGYKRVMNHSGSIALTTVVRLLLLKYTELFFLGGMQDAATVGLYDLAFSLPMMVIVFIPAAIHELFVSSFSEAYVKKPNCLPGLIRALYKILIAISIPIAVYGFMFSGDLLVAIYGYEVVSVYELTMAFCLLHVLPLISVPLSTAIQAKEKVMSLFPIIVLQLLVNIILDYVFIVKMNLGIWGAFVALLLTFLLTIPIRLYFVARLLGGIYFPSRFLIRTFFATLAASYLVKIVFTPESFLSIVAFFFVYLGVTFGLCFKLRLFTNADIADFDVFLGGKTRRILQKLRRFIESAKPNHDALNANK